MKTIRSYKGKHSRELPSDVSLPDEPNAFHAHFEASNTEAPAVLDDCDKLVADVSKTFKPVNIPKAAGPDGLPERILKACGPTGKRLR